MKYKVRPLWFDIMVWVIVGALLIFGMIALSQATKAEEIIRPAPRTVLAPRVGEPTPYHPQGVLPEDYMEYPQDLVWNEDGPVRALTWAESMERRSRYIQTDIKRNGAERYVRGLESMLATVTRFPTDRGRRKLLLELMLVNDDLELHSDDLYPPSLSKHPNPHGKKSWYQHHRPACPKIRKVTP